MGFNAWHSSSRYTSPALISCGLKIRFTFNELHGSVVNACGIALALAFCVAQLASKLAAWTETEFEQLDWAMRLNKRARILMERMAAYRFFDNGNMDWRTILEPYWQQTQIRMAAQSVVLCLQDTTELDFNGQRARGLRPLSYEAQRGMYLHPTYAVTPQREPLGILDGARTGLGNARRLAGACLWHATASTPCTKVAAY